MIKFNDKIQSDIDSLYERYKNNQGTRDFILLKAAEELNELSAELIQKVLHPTHETDDKITDELGDVFIRLGILTKFYNMDQVNNRIDLKMKKIIKKMNV